MAEFEVFRRQVPPVVHGPVVTVQRHGLLTLNRAAFEALGAPEAVKLLFDRDARVMGLHPAVLDCSDAYRVRRQSRGPGFLVSGRAFTHHYGIPTEGARRYPAVMNDNVLTVDLADDRGPHRPLEKSTLGTKHDDQTVEEACG
jgi:hypothetical protein